MRQLYKQIGTLLSVAAAFYCVYFQFSMQSYAQIKSDRETKAVVKTKIKITGNEKAASKLKGDGKVQTKGKLPDTNKASAQSQRPEWWPTCNKAAILVATGKSVEGEKMLAVLVEQARKDVPNSLDLGITLTRYGRALLTNKKYESALTQLQGASQIIRTKPSELRQQTAMFHALAAESGAFLQLQKFDKAELLIRNAIAYLIAFPDIRRYADLKKCYVILRLSLEGQNKQDEANVIADIIAAL